MESEVVHGDAWAKLKGILAITDVPSDHVLAIASGKEHRIGTKPTGCSVVARAACQIIVAFATAQVVIPSPTIQSIVTVLSIE